MKALLVRLASAAALFATSIAIAGGCTTQAYCFKDCDGDAGQTTSGTGGKTSTGSGGDGGGCLFGACTGSSSSSSTSGSSGCTPTNGGIEICDGLDNDCNGLVDDIDGLDLTAPETCGTCSNNCYAIQDSNWDSATIQCAPSPMPGQLPGKCSGGCAPDYYDNGVDGLCEYYCVKSGNDDKTCDNKDDDCDGLVDEDVDKCTSTTDCGACGHNCSLPHATPKCEHTGGGTNCDLTNTQCKIAKCECTGPQNCFWDLDGVAATGCEYPCFYTGPEICGDGIDNDCNGLIDEADSLANDPQIGKSCQGGTSGICADPAHAGVTACVSHQVVCTGANVLKPGDVVETCNGLDDDCDGTVDDSPSDIGGACGGGLFFPCVKGTIQCQNGAQVCVGAVGPQPETCDGIDNDCNGITDDNLPAAQVGAPCNVPTPPPAGATSPCMAGTTACVGGNTICVGSKGPTSPSDACGVDSNCDGTLTNQPAPSDIHNCGACGNDCLAGAVNANWGCVLSGGNYQCQFQGCKVGFYDLDNDKKCEYACTFASAQETCNNKDDNCDGQIDEPAKLVAPSISQICGVSPGATAPECTAYNAASNPGGVSVSCVGGAWQCVFRTPGVCGGNAAMTPTTCAGATETCEVTGPARDNNCNGLVNENTPNYGQPCASDAGLTAPGHGACRATGTYICATPTTTACSATKDLTKVGPELCDGIDNDCDGAVDEIFSASGSNPTFFVKPAVTKINNALWIYSYEASRPNATNIVAGTGNGYTCNTSPCPGNAPVAPAGVTLDKTSACSVQGKIPWFNVTPVEAEQTCNAMGGRVCTLADWQRACVTNPPGATTCAWGYAPNGTACTTALGPPYAVPFPTSGNKYCNLGPTYDFSTATAGDQDGLLVTGSPLLKNCYADWTALQGNNVNNGKIFDLTGNLREITKDTSVTPNVYRMMGGAFDTADEAGARCSFTFYTADQSFKLYDLGFRCCFTQDPTL